MSEGYISNREFKQYRLYDQLKKGFPSTFTDLSTETEERRAQYLRELVTTEEDMNSTEILRKVKRRFGPLRRNGERSTKRPAVKIYQRQEPMPLSPKEEAMITLINSNPEWDSDKLQAELNKD